MTIRHTFAAALAAVLAALSLSAAAAVDANQANQADLETVKGIGPALSGKILAARQQGQFKDWADFVDRVGGIGPGNAGRFSQAGLTVAGVSYAAAGGAAPAAKAGPRAEGGAKAPRAGKAAAAEADGAAQKTPARP